MLPGEQTVGGMSCSEALGLLSRWIDGELDATEGARLMAHVGSCDVCMRFGGRFQGAITRLRALGAEDPVPVDVADRLRDRLAQEG
jgi:anti-sigma factor RsiW